MPENIFKTFSVLLFIVFTTIAAQNLSYSIVDNGDETITDNATGLMWQKADDGAAPTCNM